MPDTTQARTRAGQTEPGRADGGGRGGRLLWLMPVVTFAVGVLLGAVGAGVGVDGDVHDAVGPAPGAPVPQPTASAPADPVPSAGPRPSPTAGPGASPDPGVTVTVPGSCLEVADQADELAGLVRDAAEAAGRLDAARLSDVVRQLERSELDLDALSAACRRGSATAP